MFIKKEMLFITALALLVFVCHASMSSHANDNNDNATPSPDFDGDGTVGFPDFLLFGDVFGSSQGDEGYKARFDLDGDGTIGIRDFLIFAQNYGKDIPSAGTGGSGGDNGGHRSDLVIQSFEVSDNSLTAGQSFTLETTLHNQGANTISSSLSLYRSTDATIDETDASIYLLGLASSLKSSETQTMSLDWIAPPYAGTYYYGVCQNVFTNCSTGVRVTVEGNEGGTPDLIVHTPLVSHKSVPLGGRFSFRAKVENIGTSPAATTTKRFYLSNDATIDATDKQNNRNSLFPMKRFVVGESFPYSYHWYAPFKKGTYYYGLCVDPTIGETNIDNNCSTGVPIIVEDSEEGRPDLIVIAPSILDHRPTHGEFRLWATVRNTGSGLSDNTMLRYYRSDDATIDATDTLLRTERVGSLAVDGLKNDPPVSIPNDLSNLVTAPTSPGTYYYGACVDPVPGESDTNNNCSDAVPMNVGVSDLAVGLASVSTSTPLAGQSFTLTATVRNQGPEGAAATMLRYYRSDAAIIDATDTQVSANAISSLTGFDGLVSGPGSRLAASGTSRQSVSVSAPSNPGTYYYGACVDPVPGEANTDNNCSAGVYIRVVPSGEDPFNIELVFVGDFTDARKDVMRQAARHWEAIITEGLPDVNFSANPHSFSLGDKTIVVDDTVDDLRIFVKKEVLRDLVAGTGGPRYLRTGDPTGLPATGMIVINSKFLARLQLWEPLWREERRLRDLMLHEMAHVLGFGPLWEEAGLLRELSEDAYFSGELAIEAFNAAGGESYSGNKVPVTSASGGCGVGAHWRANVFRGLDRDFGAEIMEPTIEREHALSAITIQSLADLGYIVDVSRADPYTLPASVDTYQPPTASTKPVASHVGLVNLGPIYVGDEQGNIIRTIDN